ncbi:MAG: ABC transporter permease [Treponema sp.]|jgi:spermidine/putrescine transport system permease protein|nr:ABC transporter permease [Treponema sp.]
MKHHNHSKLFPVYIGIILALIYVPIVLVILYSFNESRLSSVWGGFSLHWYRELFRDRSMFEALRNSLVLATLTSFGSAIIGTLGAYGMMSGKTGKTAKTIEYFSILPIMTPEIILGIAFLAFFSFLAIPFGMTTLVIAHTTFCVPYVYLLVKARLAGLEKSYIEAAKIMGATDTRAFYDITLPLVLPAVISGMLISFAMSFDDVIISVFVAGVHTNTLPMKIYSQIKTGVTPKTNAMCTLIFVLTVILCLTAAMLAKKKEQKNL